MAIERIARYRVEPNRVGKWFWHEIAGNGEVIGTSGQSFSSRADAWRACENAKASAAAAPIEANDPTTTALTKALRRLAADKAQQRRQQQSVLASLLDSRKQRSH